MTTYERSFVCEYCGRVDFRSGRSLGQHLRWCEFNPDRHPYDYSKNPKRVGNYSSGQIKRFSSLNERKKVGKVCCAGCDCKRHDPEVLYKQGRSQSETRLRKIAEGNPCFVPNYSHAKSGYYKDIWLRSSWERVFARYCDLIQVEWEYEPFYLPHNGKFKIPDFLVDGELYEVGWSDKTDMIEASYQAGYNISVVGQQEKELMEMFLESEVML